MYACVCERERLAIETSGDWKKEALKILRVSRNPFIWLYIFIQIDSVVSEISVLLTAQVRAQCTVNYCSTHLCHIISVYPNECRIYININHCQILWVKSRQHVENVTTAKILLLYTSIPLFQLYLWQYKVYRYNI